MWSVCMHVNALSGLHLYKRRGGLVYKYIDRQKSVFCVLQEIKPGNVCFKKLNIQESAPGNIALINMIMAKILPEVSVPGVSV